MSSEDEELAYMHPEVNVQLLKKLSNIYLGGDEKETKKNVRHFYKMMRRLVRPEYIDKEVYEFIEIGKEWNLGPYFEDALIQENDYFKKFELDKGRISLLNAKQRLALMSNENRRLGSDSVLHHNLDYDVITKLSNYINDSAIPQRHFMSRPLGMPRTHTFADDKEIHDWLNYMDSRIEIEKKLPTTLRLQNSYRNKRNRLTKKAATRIQSGYRNRIDRLNRDRIMTEYSPD